MIYMYVYTMIYMYVYIYIYIYTYMYIIGFLLCGAEVLISPTKTCKPYGSWNSYIYITGMQFGKWSAQ